MWRVGDESDWSLEIYPFVYEEKMKKKKHWANVFAIFGVVMLATAFFQEENATWGYVWGIVSVWISGKLAKEDD